MTVGHLVTHIHQRLNQNDLTRTTCTGTTCTRTERTMADVVANGVKFHVQRLVPKRRIPGMTVVFVHGLIIDNLSSFYYTLAGPVMDAGAEAFLYDLRGHGRSERPPTGYGPDDSVADLVALLDACGIDHPVYLLGNSYGAIVAARMAIAHPDRVAGIVLVEGHSAPVAGSAWEEDMANTLTAGAMRLERDDDAPAGVQAAATASSSASCGRPTPC